MYGKEDPNVLLCSESKNVHDKLEKRTTYQIDDRCINGFYGWVICILFACIYNTVDIMIRLETIN